jgi:hypothetical protein
MCVVYGTPYAQGWGVVLAKIFLFVTIVLARSLCVWAIRERLRLGFAELL